MSRFIKDPNTGNSVEVTNLDSSLKLAKEFSEYGEVNNSTHIDFRAYWKNVLNQLKSIKNEK